MCQPIATSSICDAAVPKRRATHIRMNGRWRVRSEKLGGEVTSRPWAGTGTGAETEAGPGMDHEDSRGD